MRLRSRHCLPCWPSRPWRSAVEREAVPAAHASGGFAGHAGGFAGHAGGGFAAPHFGGFQSRPRFCAAFRWLSSTLWKLLTALWRLCAAWLCSARLHGTRPNWLCAPRRRRNEPRSLSRQRLAPGQSRLSHPSQRRRPRSSFPRPQALLQRIQRSPLRV